MVRPAVATTVQRPAVARLAVARLAVAVAVVAGVLTGLLAAGCTHAPDVADGSATVEGVVDGDTIDVRIAGRDERVRLIGIDTPETERPDAPAECHADAATAFTASLLPPGTPVRIERDVVGRDHYGRLLGYVHLLGDPDDATDDVFVNAAIVEHGHAVPLSFPPNERHAALFAAAARRAEAVGRGLWSACRD